VCEIALFFYVMKTRAYPRDMLFHKLCRNEATTPVYNLLPDHISQLSIRTDDFRSIMSFLLGYIKKERQNEMLTEKLFLRFPKCTSMVQKGDLAYCIAQHKMSKKKIKCLSENFI
jgi:condensin complex subunit 1